VGLTDWLSGLNTSDYISIIALIGSLIAFFWNRAYTTRTFHQATNPELQVTADIRNPAGNLWLRLDNLHNSVTATEIKCTISIRWHTNRRTSWRSWIRYYSKTISPIRPLSHWEGLLDDHRLADVLGREFQAMKTEEIPRGSGRFDYFIVAAQAWDIRVTVRYRGAIAGSSPLTVTRQLMVQPVPKEHAYKLIQDGKEERKSVETVQSWKCR
jgi:hypothetical protein